MTYQATVLADSPLAYWRLGDASGTTMTDSSGNARNGVYQNTPALGETGLLVADADTAVKFLAAGTEFASLANAAWMNFNGDFTIECWVKPDVSVTAATARQYIAKYNTAGGGNGLYLCIDTAGKPTFGLRFAGTDVTIVSSGSAVTLGNIYHIVGVRSGTTSTLYVNGVSMGSSTNSGNPAADASTLAVGALAGIGQYADATLDEVAFYNTALSSGRVTAHYLAGTAPTETGVLAATLPHPFTAALAGTYNAIPTGALGAVLPKLTASLAGDYTAPPVPTGDLDAVLPFPTVAFIGDYHALETGSLAATLPNLTAALAGDYTAPLPETGSLAAVLPFFTVAFEGIYSGPVPTDTSNAFDGLSVTCTAEVTITEAVVSSPSGTTRVDKAVPLPLPVLVKGRPT